MIAAPGCGGEEPRTYLFVYVEMAHGAGVPPLATPVTHLLVTVKSPLTPAGELYEMTMPPRPRPEDPYWSDFPKTFTLTMRDWAGSAEGDLVAIGIKALSADKTTLAGGEATKIAVASGQRKDVSVTLMPGVSGP
jgi:hypothetical protein